MNPRNFGITSAALPTSGMRTFVVVLLLSFALSGGAGLGQAWAAGAGHGEGKGHGGSQGGNQGAGQGGGQGAGQGGAQGGTDGGGGNGASNSSAGGQSSGGSGSNASSGSGGASALGNASVGGVSGRASDTASARSTAYAGLSNGLIGLVGTGASSCTTGPGFCHWETRKDLPAPATLAAVSDPGEVASGLQVPVFRPVDLVARPSASPGIGSGLSKVAYNADALGWTAQVHTTVSGRLASANPVTADTAATSSAAAAEADLILATGYQVWMGNFPKEGDARRYWARQVRRFPNLLKALRPNLRRIHSGTTQATGYRLLGGSFASLAMAENVCGTIQSRSPLAVCRVVLN